MRYAGRRGRNHPTTRLRQARFLAKAFKDPSPKKTRTPKRRYPKSLLITNYAPELSRNTDAYVDEIKRRQPSAFLASEIEEEPTCPVLDEVSEGLVRYFLLGLCVFLLVLVISL